MFFLSYTPTAIDWPSSRQKMLATACDFNQQGGLLSDAYHKSIVRFLNNGQGRMISFAVNHRTLVFLRLTRQCAFGFLMPENSASHSPSPLLCQGLKKTSMLVAEFSNKAELLYANQAFYAHLKALRLDSNSQERDFC